MSNSFQATALILSLTIVTFIMAGCQGRGSESDPTSTDNTTTLPVMTQTQKKLLLSPTQPGQRN
jgi:hypothetical protein